ncbi:MAG TPA: hypothetical protein HPP66_08610 [Planctomycetes bacterium]|nr:hypothetical protein [Planctomycetota bacterium]
MKNKKLVSCVVAVALAILCIVGLIFFLSQEETELEREWSYPVDESEYPYPVLDSNEKVEDLSFAWYRPPFPPGGPLKFEFVGQFPKVPDKMLLYKIIRPKNVTEAYVRELANKYFNKELSEYVNIPIDAGYRRNGNFCNLNTSAYNFMFEAHTGFFDLFKRRKARKKLSEDRKDYPSDEEGIKIATEYLKERDLLPEEAYLYGASDVNIESVGAIQVWFTRKIGQYKIWGRGSTISVRIGVAGEITRVSKSWFEYEPYKLVPIKSPKEAVNQLKYGNALLATSSGKATRMELAYHYPHNDEYIQPVYSFGFENPKSYSLVPAIEPEYLKSHEEMRKKYK